MRQIGTIPSEGKARLLADYLVSHGITAHAEEDGDGWAIWVRDEAQLDEARGHLEEFRRDPDNPRYHEAPKKAQAVRREEAQRRERAGKNMVVMRDRWGQGLGRKAPLTFLLIAGSVLVYLLTSGGGKVEGVLGKLTICQVNAAPNGMISFPKDGLAQIKEGQVWRLVTPIFIHFGIPHLVFNMIMLYFFGSQIEHCRGTLILTAMVLVMAVLSNLGEYFISGHVMFGGMSGVLYGLFGYMWMKSLYQPEMGLRVSQQTVLILIVWFFVCLAGWMGNVANAAHGFGLALGVAIGYTPVLWGKSR